KTAITQQIILSNSRRSGTSSNKVAIRAKKNPKDRRYNLCSNITLIRGTKLTENVISIQAKPKLIKGLRSRSLMTENIKTKIMPSPSKVNGGCRNPVEAG